MTDYADLEKRLRDPERANGKTPIGVYGQMIREGIEAADALASLTRELDEATAVGISGLVDEQDRTAHYIQERDDAYAALAKIAAAHEAAQPLAYALLVARQALPEHFLSRAVPSTETERSE